MRVIRLVLLLVVLIGLGLFALQNWSPVLAVVFLGMKTQALPVAVWILIAIALGAVTSGVLQLLGYLWWRSLIARSRELEAENTPPPTARRESPRSADFTEDNSSDWEDEEDSQASTRRTQEWEDDEEPSAQTSTYRDVARDPTNYEVSQSPKSSRSSGTTYSYSYREGSDSGVGRPEVVRDANYRVITTPYRQPTGNEAADDWESKDEDDEDWI